MRHPYLIDYLTGDPDMDSEAIKALEYELDKFIYYYGEQFAHPKEGRDVKNSKLKDFLKYLRGYLQIKTSRVERINGKKILSNTYFSIDGDLRELGYNILCPPWSIKKGSQVLSDIKLYKEISLIIRAIRDADFKAIIGKEFLSLIKKVESDYEELCLRTGVDALAVYNDMTLFERIAIKAFKRIGKTSLIFLHGLPARYNDVDDNSADHLVVWGEKIKENYVKAGVPANKIFVSGHSLMRDYHEGSLRSGQENILVITKSMNGGQADNKKVILQDRGNMILYLYSISRVLKRLGVSSVRFRPHPCDNTAWYRKYIDEGFFKLDTDSLKNSVERSSMVIGPTSSVFLESIYHKRNYIVYEPTTNDKDNMDLMNQKLVPPFDGSDERVPVAKNEEALESLIKDGAMVDERIFSDYIKTPYDISFMKSIVK